MNSDFFQLTANGVSNVTGLMQEFEVLTRAGRSNNVDFAVCYAHQNECSGGKVSVTVKFAEATNNDLRDVLKKSQEIQVHIIRAPKGMHAYQQVQNKKECKPLLNPDPANETRWNGCIAETICANVIILGDIGDTVDALLDPCGDVYSLLTSEEKASGDTSRLSYTLMMIKRFFVGLRAQPPLQKCSQSFFMIEGMLHPLFCLRPEWLFSQPLQIHLRLYLVSCFH
jgi:hypothetical protein